MEQFSYSFIITMLHSTWQTALLLLVYFLLIPGKSSPLFKRNVLYAMLSLQLATSLVTFTLILRNTSLFFLQELSSTITSALEETWMASNAPILFYAYAFIVLWRLAHCFYSWNRFRNTYQQSLTKPGIDIRLFTQTKAYQFGIYRKVAIWCSSNITTPMTFGFWKPIILLPVALVNQLSIRETEALIIHELTHIRHLDYILNWTLIVAENLFFFNPFVHIIAKKIRSEREKNCDVQVLLFNYGGIQYAETLLKTAAYQQQELTLQMAAIRKKDQLLQRIHFFSNQQNLEFRRSQPVVSLGGLLAAFLINLSIAIFFIAGPVLEKQTELVSSEQAPAFIVPETEAGKVFQSDIDIPAIPAQRIPSSIPLVAPEKINQPESFVREEEEQAEIEEPTYAMAASSEAPTLYEGKEITIKEEGSDGKKITAVYQAILIDGIWTLQPVWFISETKTPAADSLKKFTKDSVIKIYPVVQ